MSIDMSKSIGLMFYSMWYKDRVRDKLTQEQKEAVLKRISDLSLETPIHVPGIEIDPDKFPELKPHMSPGLKKLTGMQLYAVMTEIFSELHPQMSEKIGKPYPELRK